MSLILIAQPFTMENIERGKKEGVQGEGGRVYLSDTRQKSTEGR
jgi:hypothetical protein